MPDQPNTEMKIHLSFDTERRRIAEGCRAIAERLEQLAYILRKQARELLGRTQIATITIQRKEPPMNPTAGQAATFSVLCWDNATPPNQITDPAIIAAQVGKVNFTCSDTDAALTPDATGLGVSVTDSAAGTFTLTATSSVNPALTAVASFTVNAGATPPPPPPPTATIAAITIVQNTP